MGGSGASQARGSIQGAQANTLDVFRDLMGYIPTQTFDQTGYDSALAQFQANQRAPQGSGGYLNPALAGGYTQEPTREQFTSTTYAADPNNPITQQIQALTGMAQSGPVSESDIGRQVGALIAAGQFGEQEAVRGAKAQFGATGQANSGMAQRASQGAANENAQQVGQQVQTFLSGIQAQNQQQQVANVNAALNLIGTQNQPVVAAMQQLLAQGGQFTQNAQNTPTGGQIAAGFVPLIGAATGAAK